MQEVKLLYPANSEKLAQGIIQIPKKAEAIYNLKTQIAKKVLLFPFNSADVGLLIIALFLIACGGFLLFLVVGLLLELSENFQLSTLFFIAVCLVLAIMLIIPALKIFFPSISKIYLSLYANFIYQKLLKEGNLIQACITGISQTTEQHQMTTIHFTKHENNSREYIYKTHSRSRLDLGENLAVLSYRNYYIVL